MFSWIMIKLLIFDLDNTLYPEIGYVQSGFWAVAEFLSVKIGVKAEKIFADLMGSFEKHGRGKNFDYLVEKYLNVKKEELIKIYRGHLPKIELKESTWQCLENLKKNHTICLLTNGWPEVQKQKVKALGLEKIFDKIFYAQEDGEEFKKPHPKAFERIIEYYKFNPEEILMIGDDEEADMMGASRVGMQTFWVKEIDDIKKLC